MSISRNHFDNSLTLPETNSSPLKMVVSNTNLLFQGSIFRGYVSFREAKTIVCGIYVHFRSLLGFGKGSSMQFFLCCVFYHRLQYESIHHHVEEKNGFQVMSRWQPFSNRGHYTTNPNNAVLQGKSLKTIQNYHIFASTLIPPFWGSIFEKDVKRVEKITLAIQRGPHSSVTEKFWNVRK